MAGAIEVEQHLARVLDAAHRLPAETVPLHDAAGRTLAADVRAALAIPPFENSAMDGYAVRLDDVMGAGPDTPVVLEVVADVPAGSGIDPAVAAGQAVRLMTGSPMPGAADTVVPFEETAEGLTPDVPSHVTVLAAPTARGRHVRGRADDLAVGDLVLAAGTVLGPRQLSSALSAGATEVQVSRVPRVAVVSTGSELVTDGARLERGQIPESNGPMLAGLAREAGAEVVWRGTVPDADAEVLAVLERVVDLGADVVVLTGGVSAGAYDVVKSALGSSTDGGSAGTMDFVHVRMQPGKPQGFGKLADGPLLFGLPGNPVSAAVSWEVFVRPALMAMQGRRELQRRVVSVETSTGWASPTGRRQHVPVVLDTTDPARWRVRPASQRHSGSHLVGSLALADGYAVVPAEVSAVEAGQRVDVMLVT